uniref:Putative salivary kunitz domain protein n=1 Tax=Ixodes ricinus TaxID=34613 RepID=A0A0K8RJL2_IXORI
MKLLLIAVIACIRTSGLLASTKVTCKPLYHGGYGGAGGANVKPRWSFNPYSNHCEPVMVRSKCPPSQNCFPTKDQCEEYCDPLTLEWLKLLP